VIKTKKKIIYLSVFLVLALFLISACSEVGRRPPIKEDGGSSVVSDIYDLKVGQSVTVNEVKITLIDVGSGGNIIVNEQVINAGKKSTVISLINPFGNQYYASVDVTNLKTYYADKKSDRSATLKIVKSSSKELIGNQYKLKVGEGVTLKNVELVDVGSGGNVIVSVNTFSFSTDGKTIKIGNQNVISAGETIIINNIAIKNVQAFYADVKSERSAILEMREL